MDYLAEKEKKIESQRTTVQRLLPYFESLLKQHEFVQEAEVFEGTEGIKSVRETLLKTMKQGDTIYYIGNPASGHEHMLGYWDDFNKRRVQKKIWSWTIYNQDAVQYGERRKKLRYTKVKYLPKQGPTHAWVEIYGNSMAITLKQKTPMSIVIKNPLFSESFKTYFDILWSVAIDKTPAKRINTQPRKV